MDRKEIEEKDQDLVKDIREIVRRNEEKSRKTKSFFQSMRFWLPVLVVVAIVAGTMVFNKPPVSNERVESQQASGSGEEKQDVVVADDDVDLKIAYDSEERSLSEQPVAEESVGKPESFASQTVESPSEIESPPKTEPPSEETALQATDAGSFEPSESAEPSSAAPTETGPAVKTAPTSATASSTPVEPQPDAAAEANATAVVPEKKEERAGPSIKIAKLVSCAGVQDRQYVSPQQVFSLQKISKPVVWMTVLTDKPPFTLTHVYYHNDKKYVEVPLEVNYPRMRTWSRLTLKYRYQIGRYRVEVVTEEGEVLDEIEYTVVP